MGCYLCQNDYDNVHMCAFIYTLQYASQAYFVLIYFIYTHTMTTVHAMSILHISNLIMCTHTCSCTQCCDSTGVGYRSDSRAASSCGNHSSRSGDRVQVSV